MVLIEKHTHARDEMAIKLHLMKHPYVSTYIISSLLYWDSLLSFQYLFAMFLEHVMVQPWIFCQPRISRSAARHAMRMRGATGTRTYQNISSARSQRIVQNWRMDAMLRIASMERNHATWRVRVAARISFSLHLNCAWHAAFHTIFRAPSYANCSWWKCLRWTHFFGWSYKSQVRQHNKSAPCQLSHASLGCFWHHLQW